jgi:hypothetical protein
MSYSRRQLYALGEPLGDSATYRKADGGFILGDGGGGSSSSAPSNTTSTSTQTTDLPDWAKGYAKDTLAKGAALTDVNQNPYQQYTGARIAGFSPMQQQAFQGAQNMTVAPQIGQGSGLAYGAGLGSMSLAASSNPQTFQQNVGGYMNPYINDILKPQLAEANRNYDISATKQAGQATQAGAFGGSRDAIMAAENERNRNMGLNQIYGQGMNTAFSNAQNQYNQDAGFQLQALQNAGNQANVLGNLGQSQYGQNMGINQLQAQYGGQQQALQQQGLTTAYNDFINQQNYPYKQLGFMSDLIRGLPLGQQSAQSIYTPPPSTAQTIGSIGLGAAGLGKLFGAEGGEVKAMAAGGLGGHVPGGSVLTRNYKDNAVDSIPTNEGLQAAARGAQARGDINTQLEAQGEMNEDDKIRQQSAAINRGIAGQLPPEFADNITRAAEGGIVAFGAGGDTSFDEIQKKLLSVTPAAPSPSEMLTSAGQFQTGLATMQGPDQLAPYLEQAKQKSIEDKAKGLNQVQGETLLAMSRAIGRGSSLARALPETFGAAGETAAKGFKELSEAERLNKQAEVQLVGAAQARKDGQISKATEMAKDSYSMKQKAEELEKSALASAASNAASVENAKRAAAASMYAANKPSEIERRQARLERIKSGQEQYEGKSGKEGAELFMQDVGKLYEIQNPYKYLGPDKAWEHTKMVNESLMKGPNGPVAMQIANQISALSGKTDEKSIAKKQQLEKRLEELRTQEASRYPQPSGGAQTNAAPTPGTVMQGYRFKGGDPSNPSNWEQVQ